MDWEPVILVHHHGGLVVPAKPEDWEPAALAYHNRELVVPANLWMKVTYDV
jgi:hypothetical protein